MICGNDGHVIQLNVGSGGGSYKAMMQLSVGCGGGSYKAIMQEKLVVDEIN